jgi:hypothetical protein
MPNLIFHGAAVLELLAHAKAATEHSAGYLDNPKPGPGLLFVKDDGVYLISNGMPRQQVEGESVRCKMVYAEGFESPRSTDGRFSDSQDEKIGAAAGGDDFVEFLEAGIFDLLKAEGSITIALTPTHIEISVQSPG